MNGRVYDPVLGRFLSPDNYVQLPDFTQSFNRYAYALNNPLKYTDPSGEIVWFIPVAVGAAIGGVSGYITGKSIGKTFGDGLLWYTLGGAAIGGLSAGAALGVSVIGGGAMLSGATAGAISGAGFNGLATKWDGKAMLKGATYGAISGFVGGGFGAAIGGGWGALAGGVTSNLTSQLLYNGGDFSQVNWLSVGISGAASFGLYHGMQFIQYKAMGGKLGLLDVTYRQFAKINTMYQRARFWGKEYGVYLNRDGYARFVPRKDMHKLNVVFDDFQEGDYATAHAHWAKPGKTWVAIGGDLNNMERYDPTKTYPEDMVRYTTVGGYHSDADLKIPGNSLVVGRTTSTFYNPAFTNYSYIKPDPFIRFFLFYNLVIYDF